MMTPTQPLIAEIPQVLQEALQDYLKQHPDWSQNRVLAAALALFLLQNGDGDRRASKVYLEALFRPPVEADPTPVKVEAAVEVKEEVASEGEPAAIAPAPIAPTPIEEAETPETPEAIASSPQPSATPTTA